jgi:hypothetical protein
LLGNRVNVTFVRFMTEINANVTLPEANDSTCKTFADRD